MNIKIWYSKGVKQWRWSFIDDDLNMYSGQQILLRDAMNDIVEKVDKLKGFCDDK